MAQRALAALALVELAHDLRQQAHVQEERRRQADLGVEHDLELVVGEARGVAGLDAERALAVGRLPVRAADPRESGDLVQRLLEEAPRVDRKSTRLNSSHQIISY